MLIFYFVGAMIGGAIAGLSFDAGVGTGQIAACLLSKAFLMAVFASIYLLLSVAAKQRLWLSLVASLARAMLPVIQEYLSTEEGQREFEQWRAQRNSQLNRQLNTNNSL